MLYLELVEIVPSGKPLAHIIRKMERKGVAIDAEALVSEAQLLPFLTLHIDRYLLQRRIAPRIKVPEDMTSSEGNCRLY